MIHDKQYTETEGMLSDGRKWLACKAECQMAPMGENTYTSLKASLSNMDIMLLVWRGKGMLTIGFLQNYFI